MTIAEQYERATNVQLSAITQAVYLAWQDIINTQVCDTPIIDIVDSVAISNMLHAIIPRYLVSFGFRKDKNTQIDKDLVFIADNRYSLEIKTTSSKKVSGINRKHAAIIKDDSSFYLVIFFDRKEKIIKKILFGYLESTDWNYNKSTASSIKAEALQRMATL